MVVRPPLTITRHALRHLKNMVSDTHPYVLIGAKGGGCNGLKYFIEATADPTDTDVTFEYDGLNVAVCGRSLLHLIGSNIVWKVDAMGARIEFENPNASSTCGCGETFSVKDA